MTTCIPLLLCITLLALGSAALGDSATLTVNVDQPGIKISPTLYGLFFEEINNAGDGGLYAEMVRNRSFEDARDPQGWTIVAGEGAEAKTALDTSQPLNAKNPHALRLEILKAGPGRAGIANNGWNGMALREGARYDLALYARADDFRGPLAVSLESKTGEVYASGKIEGVSKEWKKFSCTLTAKATDPAARLVIAATAPAMVWLDMVSLFPQDTFKGRPNGLRKDLAELLAALKTSFVRFPGGCFVEGDVLRDAARWKETIGDIAERPGHWNLWGYRSTDGLGFLEYLQMCEDLGAEPLFVINCGMSHRENVPMDQMGPWVQDALDAIEYANGSADTTWGALRAKHGHPAPFGLKYMEIGNENGGPAYDERYTLFYDAIKKKYPQVQLVADQWSGAPKARPIEILDEHYYSSPEFFMASAARYDKYKRDAHKIYVGEYAVTNGCGQGNLRAAVGEAAFMTGMERNSDVVVMASYAPLFTRTDAKKWNPDLIDFDSARAYGIPSYWVQQMFSANRGKVVLPCEVACTTAAKPPARHGAIGVGTWNTQAEYKDIKVTQGDKVLFEADFSKDAGGFKPGNGDWKVQEGAYRQNKLEPDDRSVAGDPAWTDYTYTLKARRLAGAEGFLIMFHVADRDNFTWWNLGGWGNSKHAIEVATGGSKSIAGEAAGKIETNRWYDIRIECKANSAKCFLDGKLVQEFAYPAPPMPVYAVASRADGGEVILKVVNADREAQRIAVELRGVKKVSGGTAIVLTSARGEDENTLAEPNKVAPVTKSLEASAPRFTYTLPPNSVTVLRIKAE